MEAAEAGGRGVWAHFLSHSNLPTPPLVPALQDIPRDGFICSSCGWRASGSGGSASRFGVAPPVRDRRGRLRGGACCAGGTSNGTRPGAGSVAAAARGSGRRRERARLRAAGGAIAGGVGRGRAGARVSRAPPAGVGAGSSHRVAVEPRDRPAAGRRRRATGVERVRGCGNEVGGARDAAGVRKTGTEGPKEREREGREQGLGNKDS
jgi:hypothetical protein